MSISQVPPPPRNPPNAAEGDHDRIPKWKKWLEIIAVTVGVAYTTIAFCQLRATLQIMRAEQRGWIYVKAKDIQPVVGRPIVYNGIVGVTGKTLARNVEGVFIVEVLNSAEDPTFNYPPAHQTSSFEAHTMYPYDPPHPFGFSPLLEIPGTKTKKPAELTGDLLEKYNNGQIWVALEAKITYEDIFGVSHWMTFCQFQFNPGPSGFVESPPAGSTKCVQYNDVDKN